MRKGPHGIEDVNGMRRAGIDRPQRLVIGSVGVAERDAHAALLRKLLQFGGAIQLRR